MKKLIQASKDQFNKWQVEHGTVYAIWMTAVWYGLAVAVVSFLIGVVL